MGSHPPSKPGNVSRDMLRLLSEKAVAEQAGSVSLRAGMFCMLLKLLQMQSVKIGQASHEMSQVGNWCLTV